MTKKEFKLRVFSNVYTGGGNKVNAMFFDRKENGYKYMVYANSKNITKKELFNLFHNWIFSEDYVLPYYINYRYAESDEKRFKVPLSLR